VLRLGVRSLGSAKAVRAGAKLTRFWRRESIDLVQTYFLDSTYFGVPLARLTGVRRVVRVRNNLGHWMTDRHRRLGRVMGRLVDATLTNCEPARRAVLEAEGGSARKVIVLENGVDLERFEQAPPPRDRPVTIGAVANLRPVKGIDVLIRAAAIVCRRFPHLTFRVAGEGDHRTGLQQLAEELGIAERFHFAGAVADIPGFLASLDLAVLPSRAEGMSNALLESMAAGRPVVATDVGANRHILSGGEFGSLIPPEDPAALANAIMHMLEDFAESMRIGAAARRHVARHYSREAMRQRFEGFYERMCA
jgi:glycosyltransferase involved in cell wall biosynthesis